MLNNSEEMKILLIVLFFLLTPIITPFLDMWLLYDFTFGDHTVWNLLAQIGSPFEGFKLKAIPIAILVIMNMICIGFWSQ